MGFCNRIPLKGTRGFYGVLYLGPPLQAPLKGSCKGSFEGSIKAISLEGSFEGSLGGFLPLEGLGLRV